MEKKSRNIYKLVMTGGHAASSAFVVAEEIRREGKPWDIYWIGFKNSFEGEKVSTLSSIYFPKYGIKTFELISGRIQRKLTLHTIPSILKIPIGFVHSFFILTRIKPNVILSFGGFTAFPVVVVAYFLGIPVIIHEQTSVVGRANKASAFFARKIAISRETSREYFPEEKTVLTGNPVGIDISTVKNYSLPNMPTIFVTGGQSGSLALNEVIGASLIELLKLARVVHLTGIKDEVKFRERKNNLENEQKDRYEVYGVVDPKKYNELFNSANLVISRAGANTISKIVVSGKPAILVPLPFSYKDEQYKNALFARKYATVKIFSQEKLSAQELLNGVKDIFDNYEEYMMKEKNKGNPDVNGAKKIVSLIEENMMPAK